MVVDFLRIGLSILASWVVIIVILSWTAALFYPLCRHCLKHLPIHARSFSYLVYSIAPLLTASFILGCYSFPEVIAPLITHHCHDVNCSPHLPFTPISAPFGSGTVLLTMIALLGLGLVVLRQLLTSRRYLQALDALSSTITPASADAKTRLLQWSRIKKLNPSQQQPNFKEIPSDQPIAWCAGLWRPQVFVSRQLRESLPPEQLSILLAHEYAHASRKDGLRKWLLNTVTYMWPKNIRETFRQSFNNDIEIIADLTAMGEQPSTEQGQWLHQAAVNCCSIALTESQKNVDQSISNEGKLHINNLNQHVNNLRTLELNRQLQYLTSPKLITGVKTVATCGLLLTLWLMMIISLMNLGHPLIEWIFQ